MAADRSTRSGLAIVVFGVAECFESGDDALQMAEDPVVVLDEVAMPAGLGGGDQLGGLIGLTTVGGQELDCGLEVSARQVGVRLRAILLGRPSAVAVWGAGSDALEVVLYPLGLGGGRDGVVAELVAVDVHPSLAVGIEGLPYRRIV